jgi:hypothetical protein
MLLVLVLAHERRELFCTGTLTGVSCRLILFGHLRAVPGKLNVLWSMMDESSL